MERTEAGTNTEPIRRAFERQAEALRLRPGIGRGTAVTSARITAGMTCEIEEGDWRLTADMPEKHGGADAGPNPGVLGRAALASCAAIGYVRWAAALGVAIDHLEVDVEADYDVRGEMAIDDDVPPGYTEMRLRVRVASPASEEEVLRVLDRADAHSSWVDNIARAVPVRREVELVHEGK